MGIFGLFKNRNSNDLDYEEKESAEILRNFMNGLITENRENFSTKFAMVLYCLAFKRSNKKLVGFEELCDPTNIMTNPKLIYYLGISKAIKEYIEQLSCDPRFLNRNLPLREYEATILYILQTTAKKINEV
jgi:hypothetical protein